MNRYRYRFNFFRFLFPVIGLISSVIIPALSFFRRRPQPVEPSPQELTTPEAEMVAGKAVRHAEEAGQIVEEVREAKTGERRGGIGRWVMPAVFILALRWLLTPPRRAGSTLFSAQPGGREAIPETRERPATRTRQQRVPAEPRHAATPARSERPALASTRVTQFDYPTARVETRQAMAAHEEPSGETDDLKVIEGIGPAIARHLNNRGIRTFSQLADTPVSTLEDILSQEGIRQLSNPHTWPEQARLAKDGQWDELRNFQQRLKAGRET